MFKGLSCHPGMHKEFPVERFMMQYPPKMRRPAIALLPGSFGWEPEIVKAFVAKFGDRPHMIEVYVSNGPGRRSPRVEWTNFEASYSVDGFNTALEKGDKKLAKAIQKQLLKIQQTVWAHCNQKTIRVICPELEDNITDRGMESFIRTIHDCDPTVKIARNPCTKGKSSWGADWIEKHGRVTCGKGQIANTDGWGIDYKDGERFFQHVSTALAVIRSCASP